MKNIKFFNYKDTTKFEKFLSEYNYKLNDVRGFKFISQKQYHGNVLKLYFICLNDGEEVYFRAVDFKDFNEYNQSHLGFNDDKLSEWYSDSVVRRYKTNDGSYVIAKH